MSEQLNRIAEKMGATLVGPVPKASGAFGAARVLAVVRSLQGRLTPGQGQRPGRPSDPTWTESPKVPMSEGTFAKLVELAEQASQTGRKVSPMQVAAQLLEDALARLAAK